MPHRRGALNILHVTADMRLAGGVSVSVAELARAQRDRDHHPLVHCSDLTSAPALDHFRAADPALRLAVSPVLGPKRLGYSPGAERWAASPAAANFDVLHQHGIWPAFSRMTIRWRDAHRRPTVIAPHGNLERHALTYSRWKKRLALAGWEKANLRRASCLHATAADEVRSFRDFGLTNPIAVIPVGVPDSWLTEAREGSRFITEHGLDPRRRILLFLSRIHPKKGLLQLVEAISTLGDLPGDWQFVIAGPVEDGAYFDAVMQRVAAAGLGARTKFVGPLIGSAKRAAFDAADLFVLPTLSDNFAIVVAEALGRGVPVLTTRAAVAWQALETARCGWWVPPGRHSLAAALATAMDLPAAEFRAMGQRGIEMVRREYLWKNLAGRTILLYRWLCGEIGRPDFVIAD